eukprot:jgi/Bigna1/75195/fgenesh1_pg.33_\
MGIVKEIYSPTAFNTIGDSGPGGSIDTDKKVNLPPKISLAQSKSASSPIAKEATKFERGKRKALALEDHIIPSQLPSQLPQLNKKRRASVPQKINESLTVAQLVRHRKIATIATNPSHPPGLHLRIQDSHIEQPKPSNGHIMHRNNQYLFPHMVPRPPYHKIPLDPQPPILGIRNKSQHCPPARQGTGCSIFVCNLPQIFRNPDLFLLFRTCGNVENVRIVTDLLTGLSKCYGFVQFDSEKAAEFAVQCMNGFRVAEC